MRIIHQDLKHGEVKVSVENLDDLWYLSHLIDHFDQVKGRTERKIKIGKDTERQKVVKKQIHVKIEVDKLDFSDQNILRINGKILEGPEDISHGSFQTIDVEEGGIITIIKEQWLTYHVDKLKEATKTKKPKILICVHDREEAIFALLKRNSFEVLSKLSGDVQKKENKARSSGDFYAEIIAVLETYKERHKLEHIILASPAFFKEDVQKRVKNKELLSIITLATSSSVTNNAISEVIKRDEVKQVLKEDRMVKEEKMVEALLAEISKGEKATFGFDHVQNASNLGAIEMLLVSDSFIHKVRENGTYTKLDGIMRVTEQNKGDVHIISSEHDAGKKIDGLGGIGAILRYKIEY